MLLYFDKNRIKTNGDAPCNIFIQCFEIRNILCQSNNLFGKSILLSLIAYLLNLKVELRQRNEQSFVKQWNEMKWLPRLQTTNSSNKPIDLSTYSVSRSIDSRTLIFGKRIFYQTQHTTQLRKWIIIQYDVVDKCLFMDWKSLFFPLFSFLLSLFLFWFYIANALSNLLVLEPLCFPLVESNFRFVLFNFSDWN